VMMEGNINRLIDNAEALNQVEDKAGACSGAEGSARVLGAGGGSERAPGHVGVPVQCEVWHVSGGRNAEREREWSCVAVAGRRAGGTTQLLCGVHARSSIFRRGSE
jgi:hypothetical protein